MADIDTNIINLPSPEPKVEEPVGLDLAFGINELREAQEALKKYKEGKSNLDKKLIENEDWWKLNHGRYFGEQHTHHPKKQSSWMFNSIMNKHADAMDNYPEPAVLAREQTDEPTAKMLSSVIPVILDNCKFEQTYSDAWWDKLINGSSVYGVFFNTKLQNGLGDIDIKRVDMLQFYWEPGVQNIQDSKRIFLLSLMDNSQLEAQYPQLKGKLGGNSIEKKEYNYDDSVDTTDKSIVVDLYYKVNYGNGDVLHYVKYVGDEILFASENDPQMRELGFYAHGKYPFVVDLLFAEKGTPAGFGYIDVMKRVQEDIDEMNKDFTRNTKWASKPRFFAKDSAEINLQQYNNLEEDIVNCAGSPNDDNVKQITITPLSSVYLSYYQQRIEELKETSGNRDFSQGATASGVTAAASIVALQEAGSKGSRDMIKGAYRCYSEICELIIELIRQFYDEPRTFRITGETGMDEYQQINNAMLQPQVMNEYGMDFKTKEPVFDIKIKAQKSSPYARVSQNELALQFYNLGFFNPQLCDQALATIDMMDFEGKQKVKETIQKNGTMFQQLQQMQQTMAQMADALAQATGDTRILQALQSQGMGGESQPLPQGQASAQMPTTNSVGSEYSGNSYAQKAQRQAQEATSPK